MTFEEMYQIVESKNRMLSTGKVAMSSDNFKKALRFAYNKGASHSAQSRVEREMPYFFSKITGR